MLGGLHFVSPSSTPSLPGVRSPSLGSPILERILGVTREWSWPLSPDPALPHREGPGATWGPLEPLFHHGGRVTDTSPKAQVAENLAPGTDPSCCRPVLTPGSSVLTPSSLARSLPDLTPGPWARQAEAPCVPAAVSGVPGHLGLVSLAQGGLVRAVRGLVSSVHLPASAQGQLSGQDSSSAPAVL